MNNERHFYVVANSDTEKYILDLIRKAGVTNISVELGSIFGYFCSDTGEILNKYFISEDDRKKVGDYLRATKYSKI